MGGVFENGRSNFPEKERVTGRTTDPHYKQVVVPNAGLAEYCILGRGVETQYRSNGSSVAIGKLYDLFEHRFLIVSGR